MNNLVVVVDVVFVAAVIIVIIIIVVGIVIVVVNMVRQKKDSSSTNKAMTTTNKKKTSSSSSIIDDEIVHRREGSCPLQYGMIREVLGYIHDHLRFILTRHGLADDNEIEPVKLSIYAILNARYMDDFKAVLLGQSFRERTWPIVKSSRAYDDIVPWLKANRCPYMYDDETVETANEYGIYRYDDDYDDDDDDYDYDNDDDNDVNDDNDMM